MKISNIQQVTMAKTLQLFAFLCVTFFVQHTLFAQGEALFKSKCSSCHQIHKNGTGPMLSGARQRWADAGEGDLITKWVQNNAALRASGASKRAAAVFKEYGGSQMSLFTDLTDDQVNQILDYADAQPKDDPAKAGANGGVQDPNATAETEEEEGGLGFIWIVLAVFFIVIILSVGGVRRQLKVASTGDEAYNQLTYWEELKTIAWKYRGITGIVGLVLTIAVVVVVFKSLYSINVMENYQPSQPIAFPHETHAGINGIDCKYCHNSVAKSKHAGLPSVNVCMNCHKQISGDGKPFAGEVKKIYAAAGWDPSFGPAGGYRNTKGKPLVWNKVHVLPDHVYFNHSQHVVVGGVDCKQCHGDMTKMKETAKVLPIEELNKVEGNIKLTKATLTMGWCIECHGAKEVTIGDGKNGYYDEIHSRLKKNKTLYKQYLANDGKLTANELGGWECAKCHY
jgi:mono/diheme cytochrome c family protein